jgi:hypothetical protein
MFKVNALVGSDCGFDFNGQMRCGLDDDFSVGRFAQFDL